MSYVPATTRLPEWLDRALRVFWEERAEGPSVGLRRSIEEWWALQQFPAIEFRDGVTGRRAGLRGGPDIWEIVGVARDLGHDLNQLARHFGERLDRGALGQALAYAERFPDEIQAWIAENDRVARFLRRHTG